MEKQEGTSRDGLGCINKDGEEGGREGGVVQAKMGLVEDGAGGFWKLLIAHGHTVCFGPEGWAKPRQSACRYLSTFTVRSRSGAAWLPLLGCAYADDFVQLQVSRRFVLDALGRLMAVHRKIRFISVKNSLTLTKLIINDINIYVFN